MSIDAGRPRWRATTARCSSSAAKMRRGSMRKSSHWRGQSSRASTKAVGSGVGARVRDLRTWPDDDLGVGTQSISQSRSRRPHARSESVEDREEVGRDVRIGDVEPVLPDAELADDLPRGLVRSSQVTRRCRPKRSVRIRAGPMPAVEQQVAGRLDEAVRAAHEGEPRAVGGGRASMPASMWPVCPVQPVRRVARVGEHGVVAELVGVDHVVGVAHRVHEPHVELRHRAAACGAASP